MCIILIRVLQGKPTEPWLRREQPFDMSSVVHLVTFHLPLSASPFHTDVPVTSPGLYPFWRNSDGFSGTHVVVGQMTQKNHSNFYNYEFGYT